MAVKKNCNFLNHNRYPNKPYPRNLSSLERFEGHAAGVQCSHVRAERSTRTPPPAATPSLAALARRPDSTFSARQALDPRRLR